MNSDFSEKVLAALVSPSGTTTHRLDEVPDGLRCRDTGMMYESIRGVPSLFKPSEGEGEDVTTRIKSFYEENPFPNYEGLEDFGQLVKKGQRNSFSATLLDSIGYNKLILECGCGTGQLSHFLQCNNNHVLGIDMSLSSLGLALEHKRRNQLERASFAQMNIFNLAIKDESFDVVISHGVLHHTYDARKAFKEIARKVKPGGIIMVGLYNYYALSRLGSGPRRSACWGRRSTLSFAIGSVMPARRISGSRINTSIPMKLGIRSTRSWAGSGKKASPI